MPILNIKHCRIDVAGLWSIQVWGVQLSGVHFDTSLRVHLLVGYLTRD
jgi:hypothetical protein